MRSASINPFSKRPSLKHLPMPVKRKVSPKSRSIGQSPGTDGILLRVVDGIMLGVETDVLLGVVDGIMLGVVICVSPGAVDGIMLGVSLGAVDGK